MKILVTYDMFREGFTELESKYDVTFPDHRDFTYDEVFQMIPEYDVLCSMFDFPVNKELIDHAPKLRLIANYAVGYNNIDVAYALQKGLTVANTPDPVTDPTANLALGLMIDTARRITECDRKLRTLRHDMKVGVLENLGTNISGKQLGIIGMGRIGKALAKRARAMNMSVVYHNRHQLYIEDETKLGVTFVSKEELLKTSDFVSINAPLTPDTFHIMGEAEFKLMKPSAILINTSRGPLVDEKALVAALQNKNIQGAGLDVFENGDYPMDELLEMDNVVLTPHIGTQTLETRIIMARTVCDNVIGFLEGDALARQQRLRARAIGTEGGGEDLDLGHVPSIRSAAPPGQAVTRPHPRHQASPGAARGPPPAHRPPVPRPPAGRGRRRQRSHRW